MNTINQMKYVFFICFLLHVATSYSMIQQNNCAFMTYEDYQAQQTSSSQTTSHFFGFVKKLTDCLTQSPQSASLSERLIPRLQVIIGTGFDILTQKDLTNGNASLRYPKNQQEGWILRDTVIATVTRDVGNIPFLTAYFAGSYPSVLSAAEKEYRIKLFALTTASQFLNKKTGDGLFHKVQAYAQSLQNPNFIHDFNTYCPDEAHFLNLVGPNFVSWFNQVVFGITLSATTQPPLYPLQYNNLYFSTQPDQYNRVYIFSDAEYYQEQQRYQYLLANIPAPTYIPFDAQAAATWILAPTLQHTAVVIDKNNYTLGNVAATQNVRYCVNVSFHNPKNLKAGQAHLDINTNVSSLYPALRSVRGNNNPGDVTITLTSSFMSDRLYEIYSKIKQWGYTVHFMDVSYDQSGSLGNNKNTFFMRSTGQYYMEFIYPYQAYADYQNGTGPFNTVSNPVRHLAVTAGNGSLIYLPNESATHIFLKSFEKAAHTPGGSLVPSPNTPLLTFNSRNYISLKLDKAFNGPLYRFSYTPNGIPIQAIQFHYHALPSYIRYRTDLLYLNNPELQEECEQLSYVE